VHKNEVRLFRNGLGVRSYRDSLGFRKYRDFKAYANDTEKGEKLRVKKINAPIYHYTEVRGPGAKTKKASAIGAFYEKNDGKPVQKEEYGYDRLEKFTGTHPRLMNEKVKAQDWEYVFNPKKAVWRTKDRIMQPIEDILGFKIGEYKNYKLIK